MRRLVPLLVVGLASAAALAALRVGGPGRTKSWPPWIRSDVQRSEYDDVRDDLLTGGLGRKRLELRDPPPLSEAPTKRKLRRRAIYHNYRNLVDMGPQAFGVLYGPNVTADGEVTTGEGLIPGIEYLAFADDGSGRENVTLMVQIPATFNQAKACIVTAPSSGSRSVYGAIATSGEWGLKRGCAVAYTDKGTGVGAHNLEDDRVSLITGVRADADAAGRDSNFTVPLSDREAHLPHRFAWKHAHSQRNPEADWDRDVLRSIEFAFSALNAEFGGGITPENTIVIASSVSNGGGASLRAAEIDRQGLIDGVAVSEPNVTPHYDPGFAIVQGSGPPLVEHSRPLYDYATLLNVYQGCANQRDNLNAPVPLNPSAKMRDELGNNRCVSLAEAGLIAGRTVGEQATHAQEILTAAGLLPDQNVVQPSHWWFGVPQSISITFANAYARSPVTDGLCGYSFAGVDAAGAVRELSPDQDAKLFGEGSGIPPTAGVDLINDRSVGGPRRDLLSFSPSTTSPSTGRRDQNLGGARCLRALWDGEGLDRGLRRASRQLHRSIDDILATADLGGRPAVIVTGRADAVIAPNHASRAYFGRNQRVEGEESGLRYYEILNAQHLDAFNSPLLDDRGQVFFPGFETTFIPLHYYFIQALDLVYDHLTRGTPLPPSQVVRTTPRSRKEEPFKVPANLPPVAAIPAAADAITFDGSQLAIPD